MIEMTRAAFASAREIDAGLNRIDTDDLVYFLARDIVEMGAIRPARVAGSNCVFCSASC